MLVLRAMRKLALLLALGLACTPALAEQAGVAPLVHGLKTGHNYGPLSAPLDHAELGRVDSRKFGSLSFGTISGPVGEARRDLAVPPLPDGNAGPSGFSLGGYLSYKLSDYGLEATWRDDGYGGSAGGVGATYGSRLGFGTAYAVRIGAGFGESGLFSPNLATPGDGGNEVNLSVTLTHAITPNMSVNGMAGAARYYGNQDYGTDVGSRDYRIGAGFGLRF